jgi:hypothetical protein
MGDSAHNARVSGLLPPGAVPRKCGLQDDFRTTWPCRPARGHFFVKQCGLPSPPRWWDCLEKVLFLFVQIGEREPGLRHVQQVRLERPVGLAHGPCDETFSLIPAFVGVHGRTQWLQI